MEPFSRSNLLHAALRENQIFCLSGTRPGQSGTHPYFLNRLHEIEEDRRTTDTLNNNDHSIEIIKKHKKNETNSEIDNTLVNHSIEMLSLIHI